MTVTDGIKTAKFLQKFSVSENHVVVYVTSKLKDISAILDVATLLN